MAAAGITRFDQTKQFTAVRADDSALDVRVGRSAIRQADRAFQSFFRRVKAGEKPGHSRFKAGRRFRTLELSASGRNWLAVKGDPATVRVKGLPELRRNLHRPFPEDQPQEVRTRRGASTSGLCGAKTCGPFVAGSPPTPWA